MDVWYFNLNNITIEYITLCSRLDVTQITVHINYKILSAGNRNAIIQGHLIIHISILKALS